MNTASVELPALHASGDSETFPDGCAHETELASSAVDTVCSEGVLNGGCPVVSDDTVRADADNEYNAVQALHNASFTDLAPSDVLLEVQAPLVCERAAAPLKPEINSASSLADAEKTERPVSDELVRAVTMGTSAVEVYQAGLSAAQELATELGPRSGSGANDVAESSPTLPDQSSAPQCHDGAKDEAPENFSVVQAASDVVCHLLNCVENGGKGDDVMVVSTANVDQQAQSVGTKQAGAGSPPKFSSRKAHMPTKVQLVPYRENEDTSSSDSSASSSSDSDDEVVVTEVVRRRTPKGDSDCSEGDDAQPGPTKRRGPGGKPPGRRSAGLKTPGELDIDDLPPIEDLHITLPRAELRQAGRVRHAVDQLLVVESEPGQPVLDLDSVLFRADGTALGRVFDVLGPVAAPYYTVRFNSAEELAERGFEPGEPLLYAPLHADVTQYVLESEIRKLRGSDASWENNNEPPLEHLDFSDDEQEREMRKQLRAARSGGSASAPAASAGGVGDRGDERQHASRGRGRGGASRGGRNRDQQQRQFPEATNGVVRPRVDAPSNPKHFQGSNRPQWPPSQGLQQRWPCSPAAIRFQPNVPPPPNPQAPLWTASPRGNGSMPNVWNTPPPPMAAGASSLSWQQKGPFFNRPPVFPNLRTPPPNFGSLMPRMMIPPPCPPQRPFPAHHELCINPSVGAPGSQQAPAMNLLHRSPLPSPVCNSVGQRVPLYDPVPDLNRILTSPPPSAQ